MSLTDLKIAKFSPCKQHKNTCLIIHICYLQQHKKKSKHACFYSCFSLYLLVKGVHFETQQLLTSMTSEPCSLASLGGQQSQPTALKCCHLITSPVWGSAVFCRTVDSPCVASKSRHQSDNCGTCARRNKWNLWNLLSCCGVPISLCWSLPKIFGGFHECSWNILGSF